MKKRMLGNIEVGAIGMGCMGFSHAHGDPAPRQECIKMMRTAHELGVTLYDTADVYDNGHNEILVGEALKPIRDEVVVLTKFNPEKNPLDAGGNVAAQIEAMLDASGFLSGAYKPGMKYSNDDIHRTSTWFTDENLMKNQPVLDMLDKLAGEKDATYAQIALAYLMHKYDRLVPIPGMYEERFIHENLRTAEIELTEADMTFIDTTLDGLTLYGDCKEDKVFALGDMLKEEGYVIEKSWKNK